MRDRTAPAKLSRMIGRTSRNWAMPGILVLSAIGHRAPAATTTTAPALAETTLRILYGNNDPVCSALRNDLSAPDARSEKQRRMDYDIWATMTTDATAKFANKILHGGGFIHWTLTKEKITRDIKWERYRTWTNTPRAKAWRTNKDGYAISDITNSSHPTIVVASMSGWIREEAPMDIRTYSLIADGKQIVRDWRWNRSYSDLSPLKFNNMIDLRPPSHIFTFGGPNGKENSVYPFAGSAFCPSPRDRNSTCFPDADGNFVELSEKFARLSSYGESGPPEKLEQFYTLYEWQNSTYVLDAISSSRPCREGVPSTGPTSACQSTELRYALAKFFPDRFAVHCVLGSGAQISNYQATWKIIASTAGHDTPSSQHSTGARDNSKDMPRQQ